MKLKRRPCCLGGSVFPVSIRSAGLVIHGDAASGGRTTTELTAITGVRVSMVAPGDMAGTADGAIGKQLLKATLT